MEVDHLVSLSVVLKKKVMEVADDSIATFAGVDGFISEVLYLLRKSFAANSKDATLSGSQEVDGSRLGRHAWEVSK